MNKELIRKAFINAQKSLLTELLEEFESEGYTTMAQVRGAMYKNLDVLEKLENEKN